MMHLASKECVFFLFSICYYCCCSATEEVPTRKFGGLTIFTALERFEPGNAIAMQAFQSWYDNADNVLIYVDKESECTLLKKAYPSSNVQCFEHHCMDDELNIPTISCILLSAENTVTTNLLMYTNADIIFSSSLRDTVNILTENKHMFDKLIAVGRRTDVTAKSPLPTNLISYAQQRGVLHSDHGIDYFMYRKGSLPLVKMPAFVVGNIKWDNWLLSELLIRNLTSVVDVTMSCLAVHVGLTTKYVKDRPGFKHNEELWKISRFGSKYIGLGSVAYAGFYTNGTRLLPRTNEHANLIRMLYSQLHRSGFLFVVTVSSAELSLLDNWLCWAKRIKMQKFLIFAMDNTTQAYTESRRLLTYYPQENKLHYPVMTSHFKTMSEDDKLYSRAKFLYSILRAGISFVSLYPETIFISDPLLKVAAAGDVLTLKSMGKDDKIDISDRLLGMTSSEDGRGERFIKKLLKCIEYKNNVIRLNGSKYDELVLHSGGVYRSCLNDIYLHEIRLKHEVDQIAFNFLDLRVASSGASFYNLHLPQSNGFTPSMISADDNSSVPEKAKLLRDWNLWLRTNRPVNGTPAKTVQSCKGSSPKKSRFSVFQYPPQYAAVAAAAVEGAEQGTDTVPAAVPEEQSSAETCLVVIFRIITCDRPIQLRGLLKSLLQARYDIGPRDAVDIEVLVNYPDVSRGNMTGYVETLKILKKLPSVWKHGTVTNIFFNSTLLPFDLWVRPLRTVYNNRNTSSMSSVGGGWACRTTISPLDDNVRLSPSYYQWSRQILLKYGPEEHSDLYGFSLQRQRIVLGAPKLQVNRMGHYLDLQVDRRLILFSYQLTSSWGQFYYPQHWNGFARWARRMKRSQPDFMPCVPYFFSNRFLLQPNQMWSLWFTYYAFFHGLYSLYVNYPAYNDAAEYGHIIVNRLDIITEVRGQQFKNVVLVNESTQLNLAPLAYYPLFDFFFQKVDDPSVLKDRWRFISNFKDLCVMNDLSRPIPQDS